MRVLGASRQHVVRPTWRREIRFTSVPVLVALLVGVLTACSAAGAVSAAAEAKARRCGSVGNKADTGAAVGIRAVNVTCKRARRVARSCVNTGRARGWRATETGRTMSEAGNTSEFLMRRGTARVYLGYVGGTKGCGS